MIETPVVNQFKPPKWVLKIILHMGKFLEFEKNPSPFIYSLSMKTIPIHNYIQST